MGRNKTMLRKVFFVIGLMFFGHLVIFSHMVTLHAEDPVKAAKARMMKRLNTILELKQKGIVGEDNRGYLAPLRQGEQYRSIIEAENRDRRIIYEYIARTQGVDLSTVERLRAKQIRKRALKGQWIQTPDGKWIKKE